MAESEQPASHGAAAQPVAFFDAPGEGKGNSALPEARASAPGLDPRWPPVLREGEGGEAVVIIVESSEVLLPEQPTQAPASSAGLLTEEEVKKHNTKDDCWVRPRARCPAVRAHALIDAHCAALHYCD
jgi:hypothetical protein